MGKQDNFTVDCMILKYLLLFPALLKPGLAVWFAWANKYDRSDVNHFWRETFESLHDSAISLFILLQS